MIKFLHAGDLHLGLRVTRFEEDACARVGEARFTALQQLRQKAAELSVDFILVAGDVFDDHAVSRGDATRAFPILESSSGCPVFVIPGNHDPLVPGGVWDRDPWRRAQPIVRVHVLRERMPLAIPEMPVTLFPCPLQGRRSMDDPTAWMAEHPRKDGERGFRLGLAHGSLNLMKLPDDDHLIRPDAADAYGLDYLALGHWHKTFLHPAADGATRTAYCGTHEPMGFSGAEMQEANSRGIGWSSYSSDGEAERFRDDGVGSALLVTIDAPGAPPKIERINVGRLRWQSETRDVTSHPIGSLIKDISTRASPELTILRLTLSGVLDPQGHGRLEELKSIVQNRFHAGSQLSAEGVLIEPNAEQLSAVVGDGVVKRVLERLQQDASSSDAEASRVARQAVKLLYQIAWEEQPA